MLKQPLPNRARRWFGGAFVAATIAAASFAVWAAQPPQGAVAGKAVPMAQFAGVIEMTVDGAPPGTILDRAKVAYVNLKQDTPPRDAILGDSSFGLPFESPFEVAIRRGGETWTISGTVLPKSDGAFYVDATLVHNGSIAGHPQILVRAGEPGGIKVGDAPAGAAGGLSAQFTFHRGPGHEPGVTEVSYRRLTRIDYPQSATVANAQGVVYIAVHVAADGSVARANVDSVLPIARTDLADAALNAVKTWTFNPLTVDGKTAESDTTVAVAFSLDPNRPLKVVPGVLDAIRISPAPPADADAVTDTPASADVAFRRMHPPKYPASAIKAHEQGKVVLRVHVDANGKPIEALVDKTDPPNLSSDLGDAAIAAAMQWQFNPAHRHGKAVDDWVNVPVDFSLHEL